MSELGEVTRRQLLRVLAFLGLLPLARSAQIWTRSDPETLDPDGSLAAKIVAVFGRPASAQAVGARFLRDRPERTCIAELLQMIAHHDRTEYERLREADPVQLRALLRRQQQADFASGRIVKLDGWILCETEVHLCALSRLLA